MTSSFRRRANTRSFRRDDRGGRIMRTSRSIPTKRTGEPRCRARTAGNQAFRDALRLESASRRAAPRLARRRSTGHPPSAAIVDAPAEREGEAAAAGAAAICTRRKPNRGSTSVEPVRQQGTNAKSGENRRERSIAAQQLERADRTARNSRARGIGDDDTDFRRPAAAREDGRLACDAYHALAVEPQDLERDGRIVEIPGRRIARRRFRGRDLARSPHRDGLV